MGHRETTFLEKSHEFAAGAASGGFAVNPPADRVQSRI